MAITSEKQVMRKAVFNARLGPSASPGTSKQFVSETVVQSRKIA
jgi:hypothetical protein